MKLTLPDTLARSVVGPLFSAAASCFFLLACSAETLDGGSTGSSTTRLSCDNRALESTCAEFPTGTTNTFAKDHCDGSVIEEACPRADTVGTCSLTQDSREMTNVYYASGTKPWSEASAREVCEQRFSGAFRSP